MLSIYICECLDFREFLRDFGDSPFGERTEASADFWRAELLLECLSWDWRLELFFACFGDLPGDFSDFGFDDFLAVDLLDLIDFIV